MFDILMYLFENYIYNETEVVVEQNALTKELQKAGFHSREIYQALGWLEQLSDLQYNDEKPYLNRNPSSSVRIYTEEETRFLDSECQNFLMFLEHTSVIDAQTREMVIDRVFALDKPDFILEDLKWVVLMVLFNVPGKEHAYTQMEDLIFEEPTGLLH